MDLDVEQHRPLLMRAAQMLSSRSQPAVETWEHFAEALADDPAAAGGDPGYDQARAFYRDVSVCVGARPMP